MYHPEISIATKRRLKGDLKMGENLQDLLSLLDYDAEAGRESIEGGDYFGFGI